MSAPRRRRRYKIHAELPSHPSHDGLHVFCGHDARVPIDMERMAASSHAAGIPTLVLGGSVAPATVRWPPVRRAAVFAHDALPEGGVVALVTAMIDAGIDEVFVAGGCKFGPATFRVA